MSTRAPRRAQVCVPAAGVASQRSPVVHPSACPPGLALVLARAAEGVPYGHASRD